jgi:hypothetical protein
LVVCASIFGKIWKEKIINDSDGEIGDELGRKT